MFPRRNRARPDHRRCQRRGDRGDLDVQTPLAGVAVRGGLLGVTVDLTHGVIDIDERDSLGVLGTDDHARYSRGQTREQAATDSIELLDMPVGERAQERAQCRGCPHPSEQATHRAVAEQVQVIDRIGAGHHPAHHNGRLHRRVRRAHAQPLLE